MVGGVLLQIVCTFVILPRQYGSEPGRRESMNEESIQEKLTNAPLFPA